MCLRAKRLWFVVAIPFAALLAACLPGSTAIPPPTPTPLPTPIVPENPTYTVQRGTVVEDLTFTGRVSPVEEAELFFRTDGRLLKVHVARGDAVLTGDVLAELDVETLHRQMAQAELALAAAQRQAEK